MADHNGILIPGTQYHLVSVVRSVAAKHTHFHIPELNIVLDAGWIAEFIPDHIFVTHCHRDHCRGLPDMLMELGSARQNIERHIDVYVPISTRDAIENMVITDINTSKNNPKHTKAHKKYTIHGVQARDVLELTIKKTKFEVKVFWCDHTVPTRGFGFTRVTQALKDEYVGMEGRELGQLKRDGIDITEDRFTHQFIYLGDTSIKVFEDEEIFKYPVIIVECTFLEDDDLKELKKSKHIHWNHLKEVVKDHPDNTFILYHFSQRYSASDVTRFFANKPDNVILT